MSEDLERLIGKASSRNFFDTPDFYKKAEPTEKLSVRRDSFDERAWKYIADQVPALREQVDALAEDHPTSPEAYEDLFNLLNQGDPRFRDPETMVPEYRPQSVIMKMLDQAEDIGYLRSETRYDDYNTALAMLTMQDRMKDAFDDLQDLIDAIEQMEAWLAEALANAQEALAEGAGGQEAADELAKAMQAVMEAHGASQEQIEAVGKALAEGVKEASDKIDAEKAKAASYGMEPGDLKKMDFESRAKLVEKLDNEKITRFANLAGQFRMYADAERRRKVVHAPAEIYDVELGNNLSRLVASERNALAIPELEDQFWLRFAKQGLLQWKTRGPEHQGKGPIIVVCDESGSMGAPLDQEGNTREAWSKAVSLALCDQAKRGKRDFIYVGFSSGGQVWETHFEGGDAPVDQVIEFAGHFFGGGTSYEQPLTRAMEIIGEYADAHKPAPDVVFISDDECRVGQEFIDWWGKAKDAADVKCYGLQVGGGSGYSNAMGALVDQAITIDRLAADPEALSDLFRQI